MRIEVYVNGRLEKEVRVTALEVANNLYYSWDKNCEKREAVVERYIKKIKEDMKSLLEGKMFVTRPRIDFVICLESKMNKAGFCINELKKVG